MGATHRSSSVALLGLALTQGWPPLQTGAGVLIALAVAGGRLSPDLDQYRGWRLADKILPDEVLGHGGPMRRGITHWWGIPLAVGIATFAVPQGLRWLVLSVLAGWVSHLVGDFIFGRADAFSHRGPGIPLAPWWGHVGLGYDAGGTTERITRDAVLPAVVLWQALMVVNLDEPVLEFLRRMTGA